MRLEHNEFCEEITRRKNRINQKRKERKRLAVFCASLCICLCVVAAMPWRRMLDGESNSESSRLDGVSVIVTLPSGSSSEEIKTADGKLVAELLCFIESNSAAFSRVVDDLTLDSVEHPEIVTAQVAEAVEENAEEPSDDAENASTVNGDNVYVMSGEYEDYVITYTQGEIKYGINYGSVSSEMYIITFEDQDGKRESFCFDPDENGDVAEQLQRLLSELY